MTPKEFVGFEPRSFNIKAKSQLWELAYNILRRFIPITFILDKYFNILSASLLCLWNGVVNKSWDLAFLCCDNGRFLSGYCWSLEVRGHSFKSQSSFDHWEKQYAFCLFNLEINIYFSKNNFAVNNQNLR